MLILDDSPKPQYLRKATDGLYGQAYGKIVVMDFKKGGDANLNLEIVCMQDTLLPANGEVHKCDSLQLTCCEEVIWNLCNQNSCPIPTLRCRTMVSSRGESTRESTLKVKT